MVNYSGIIVPVSIGRQQPLLQVQLQIFFVGYFIAESTIAITIFEFDKTLFLKF